MPRDVFASLVMTVSYFFGSLGPGGGAGAAVVAVVAMGPVEGVTAGAARFAVFVDGASATACSGLCRVNVHEPNSKNTASQNAWDSGKTGNRIDLMVTILLPKTERHWAVACESPFDVTPANGCG